MPGSRSIVFVCRLQCPKPQDRNGPALRRRKVPAPNQDCPLCGHKATRRLLLSHTAVLKCANTQCRLMFAYPQLDSDQLDAAYRHFYYPASDAQSAIYENTDNEILTQMFTRASLQFGSLAGKSLLDYGCGLGRLCRTAGNSSLRATRVDFDGYARQAASKIPGLRVYPDIGHLRSADPDARFDIITMWEVVEHLRQPWRELREVLRLLHPDGWLL